MNSLSAYKNWYKSQEQTILRDFFTFLSFPSISADPAYKDDVLNCANWVKDYLTKMGMQTRLLESGIGYPAVYASSLKAGDKRPTLLLYHHYDVQPIDPIELWKSDPFVPTLRGGEVFARGAADNKGQCFYTLTALRAFFELCKNADVNLKIFIEGEEESGGESTKKILEKYRDELKADYLLIVDSGLPKKGVGAISLGVRGIMTAEVQFKNSKIDLHSGTHGGIALNPNHALIRTLAKLWDENGRICLPGFYQDVSKLEKEQLAEFWMKFDLESYQTQFDVQAFCNEPEYSLAAAGRIRPTLEINGISGGYAGAGFKTVIPSTAQAKISCRLVANQDPEKVFQLLESFLKKETPKGIKMHARYLHGAKPFIASAHSPIAKLAKMAYEEVLEGPCQQLLMGGSIPIVGDLTAAAGAETLLMGYGLDEDDIHAPNEHFGLDRMQQGFLTMTRIFELFGK